MADQPLGELSVRLAADTADYERMLAQAEKTSSATAKVMDKLSSTSTRVAERLGVFRDAQGRLRNSTGRFLSDTEKAALGLNRFQFSFEGISRKIQDFGKSLSTVGDQLTTRVTLPVAALAGVSVKAFSDFDSAMTKSLAIMDDVTPQMRKELERTAIALSKTTSTSAKDLAEAYGFLASAGLDVQQSIRALPAVEQFATAGAFELEKATLLLVDAQNALGLTSKDAAKNLQNMVHVSDVLTKGGIISSTSVEQLAKSLTTKAASAMRALNIEVEEGVAVLSAYASQGIKAEQAGEKFDILLRELQHSVAKNSGAWRRLGLSVFDAEGNMRPLAEIIGQLERTFQPMSDQQKSATAAMLGFRSESFAAIRPLLGMSQTIAEYEKQLRSAGGATATVAQKQLQSLEKQFQILKNQVTAIAIEIGGMLIPVMKSLLGVVRGLVDWWGSLSKETKLVIVSTVGLMAVIGPLFKILGFLIPVITAVWTAFASWGAALLFVGAAVIFVTDLLLQLFDVGNLGVIDMVNNFRVGGTKIGTWMTSVWLLIFKAWNFVKLRILQGWEELKLDIAEIGAWIFRKMLVVAQGIAEAFLKALDFATFGKFSDQFVSAMASTQAFFNEQINESLKNSEERHQQYYTSLIGLERDYLSQKEAYTKALDDLFAKDAAEADKARVAAERAQPKLADLSNALGGDSAGADAGKKKLSLPTGGKDQSFEVISLSRFALEGPGGLARDPKKQEQKVSDEGVRDAVHEVRDVLRTHSFRTTLG